MLTYRDIQVCKCSPSHSACVNVCGIQRVNGVCRIQHVSGLCGIQLLQTRVLRNMSVYASTFECQEIMSQGLNNALCNELIQC